MLKMLAIIYSYVSGNTEDITPTYSSHLLLLFSRSVVSDSLWLHGLQPTRLPCPSLSPGACSNSCPLSRWCHPNISSSVLSFFSCLQSFPRVFPSESVLHIRWPKYWSFSFSPSNEYSEQISFRIDWFDPCSPRDSQESSPTPQFKSITYPWWQ